MKKKLEADLISIAHRILKLKNKSELIQLHQETQKLYEKLSVLLFVEENFGDAKPTIGLDQIKSKISNIFDDETTAKETANASVEKLANTFIETAKSNKEEATEVLLEETTEKDVEEALIVEEAEEEEIEEQEAVEQAEEIEEIEEEIEEQESDEEVVKQIVNDDVVTATIEEVETKSEPADETLFKPAFELSFDAKEDEVEIEKEVIQVVPIDSQIRFDDLLGPNYTDPVFVKPEEIEREIAQKEIEISERKAVNFSAETKSTSINDQVSKGIAIGLNDRLGFIKHLFGNSPEDYNRVLSQLITYNTLEETQLFIEEMVKPDYNDWEGKDEYSNRFMEIIEKKFS